MGKTEPYAIVESPETMLNAVNRTLLSLRVASQFLGDKKLDEELVNLLRKTVITEAVHQRYVVAVAGTQGAGKTTFVQRLTGVDPALLGGNLGRGERMPILIVEDEKVAQPVRVSRDIVASGLEPGSALTGLVSLSEQEWAVALEGRREQSVALELKVPPGVGLGAGRALLLLPGYEAKRMENAAWQELMRQALVSSAMSIVVTDGSRLADERNASILADIKQFLRDATPLVVLTKTERASADDVDALRATAGREFSIDASELGDRVLVSDEDTDREDLRAAVLRGIDLYGGISVERRQEQLSGLQDLVSIDLDAALSTVEDRRAARGVAASSPAERTYEETLAEFDRSVDRLRRDFDKALTRAAGEHRATATKIAKSAHNDDIEGMRKLHIRIIRFFTDSAGDQEERLNTMIETAWMEADPRTAGFTPAVVDAIGHVVSTRLAVAAPARYSPGTLDERLPALRFPGEAQAVTGQLSRDLELLSTMDVDTVQRPSAEWRPALQLLPVLALEFVRTSQIAPELVAVDPATLASGQTRDPAAMAAALGGAFSAWGTAQKALIGSFATVLGLDLLIDGEINSIPALANAASVALTGAGLPSGVASAASVAVGASAALVAVGALTAVAANEVRRIDQRDRAVIEAVMGAVSDAHLAFYRNGFDDVMAATREVLDARLRRWLHLDADFARDQWLTKVISDVRERATELREAVAADPRSLGVALRASS